MPVSVLKGLYAVNAFTSNFLIIDRTDRRDEIRGAFSMFHKKKKRNETIWGAYFINPFLSCQQKKRVFFLYVKFRWVFKAVIIALNLDVNNMGMLLECA